MRCAGSARAPAGPTPSTAASATSSPASATPALVGRACRLDRGARQRLEHDRRRAEGGRLRQPQGRRHRSQPAAMSPGSTAPTRSLPSTTTLRFSHASEEATRQGQGRSGGANFERLLARLRNRRFFSLYELNAAIRETVADLNAKIMRKLGVSRDELFAEIDWPALKKPFRRSPISLPSGRSVGPRPTTTLRSPITITPCRRASSASNSRHASPTPRSRSCTKACVWRAMPVLMRAVGTQRFPSTCRASTGATPSGRRLG